MSIVKTALYIYVPIVLVYSFKDWFKGLCGLILMMAVSEHKGMPKSMFGIQGFNMWNVLFSGILLAWCVNRRHEGLTWDMPQHVSRLLLLYMGVIVVGFLRAVADHTYTLIPNYSLGSLISEELINTIKWVLPGLLLFDGCRSRRRVIAVVVCLFVVYSLIAIQVSREVSSDAVRSHWALEHSRFQIGGSGYNACNISALCAGAFWAALALLPLASRKKYKLMALLAAGLFAYALAITGGRAGYIAWGATGFVLCVLKWRKQLILAPVVVVLLPLVFPAAYQRLFVGFGATDVSGATVTDKEAVASGRLSAWPYVIDKIGESPIVGHGRKGIYSTGLTEFLLSETGFGYGHPHNMYLETLLDNGIAGSLPIFLFWGIVIVYSARLFRSDNRLYTAVGGLALALVLTQLYAGIGSQHFYPMEENFGVWMAMFLALRVYVEEKKAQIAATSAERDWNESVSATRLGVTAPAHA